MSIEADTDTRWWITAKSATGFTINTSTAAVGVRWTATR